MKTFDEIYEELQSTNNKELNEAWKEAKKESEKANKIAGIICLIIDIFFVIAIIKNMNSNDIFGGAFKSQRSLILVIYALVLNVIIFGFTKVIFSKNTRKYAQMYKNIVINKLMSNFYNNLEYFPQKEMPEYIYEKANYNEYYNRYHSEDYLEAVINNKYSIQMAEIKTQKEESYTDSQGRRRTETTTIFNGLFSKILMHKSIKGELRIEQNGTMIFDKKRLEMDSSEFEKYFEVKSSDKILGMRLLTADIMEELIEFQNKTNMKYDIYIKDNELYLRFHSGPMFEVGRLKNGAIDKETLRKYFYMLNFTYNLSNKLINLVNQIEI